MKDTYTETFLKTSEAAELLRLSAGTLANYRSIGFGPKYRKHGHVVVYHINDVYEWSEKHCPNK
ncbi:MAG: helix-turn-helix domain-containing protein [Pseudomonadota bacterium]